MGWDVTFHIRKYIVPEFVFGPGSIDLTGQYAHNLGGGRALIVSDSGVNSVGWVDQVIASLRNAGLDHVLYLGVTPNPRAAEVMAGAELFLSEKCDLIVGVGGGSPLDCAKGIGIVASNGRGILEFVGIDKVSTPSPPLIAVPTTTSSSDLSQIAAIDDVAQKRKCLIISKAVLPDLSLIDPLVLNTLDTKLLANTAIDAFTHALEAFVSVGHSPITDMHALEAIKLIALNLAVAIECPENMEPRRELMLAGVQAGIAFSNAGLGAGHAMAHSIGAFLDLPHGECSAAVCDSVIDFNFAFAPERYEAVAKAMGLRVQGLTSTEIQKKLQRAIRELRSKLGLAERLSDFGVGGSDIHQLAARALEDPCVVTNPRRPSQRDIEVIYELAL